MRASPEVARRYEIAERVLFRWKQEMKPTAAPMFVAVEVSSSSSPNMAPIVIRSRLFLD
jgi:hypothetical protein